jgi:YVTN family beta-propeller protein
MQGSNGKRRFAVLAPGFAALWAALVLAVVFSAWPAEAAPFAYVADESRPAVWVIDTATNTVVTTVPLEGPPGGIAVAPDGKHVYVTLTFLSIVSVIDTATNTVVATVPVGSLPQPPPQGIAVTADGTRAYVANLNTSSVSVIDTASNTMVATVPVGAGPVGVAVTADGKHAEVTNQSSNDVSVIDTASNTVVATVPVGVRPIGVAVTPDGKHAYVTNHGPPFIIPGTVSVIDTATNNVVGTVTVGVFPGGIAITPDGKHAYVTNAISSNVSVIDTATNTVVATVPVGFGPDSVALTPDGADAYVANYSSGTISVIDTAKNTVVATISEGIGGPVAVGIVPPPTGVLFSAFSAKLEMHLGKSPNTDHFNLNASFVLGSVSNGINPPAEPVTLKVGTFTTTIPPGSFKIADDQDDQDDQEEGVRMKRFGPFKFHGVIDGVDLRVLIRPTGTKRYALEAEARHADLTGTKNPVPVTLTIGGDSGTVLVKAHIDQKLAGRDDD